MSLSFLDPRPGNGLSMTGEISVYRKCDGQFLRSCGEVCDLSQLWEDEFFSFVLKVENKTARPYRWKDAWVTVNGGEEWHWAGGEIPEFSGCSFPIYPCNMEKCQRPGNYTLRWYFDGREAYCHKFCVTDRIDRIGKFPFPSSEEIRRRNRENSPQSPYVFATFTMPDGVKYTEYSVEFKADHTPDGSYWCLGCWAMDYSSLLKKYRSYRTETDHCQAYGGFQKIHDGTTVSILSFWDILCETMDGRQETIRAKRVYPKSTQYSDEFWGEGTGAHCTVDYPWQKGRWYRMHLKCRTAVATGNTAVEQWVTDVETGGETLLCSYDTGVKGAVFKNAMSLFLENYLSRFAGEVRSMEVRNAKYKEAITGRWIPLTEAVFELNGGPPSYEGSYEFDTENDRFRMITSGVGGDWYNNGKGQKSARLRVAKPLK